jgi:hypothetical protein
MLENEESKILFSLNENSQKLKFSMSAPPAAPELALLGIGGNLDALARARRESSYSVQTGGIVVTYTSTVLASLGLNTYLRDKGGEGWSGARR